MRFGRKVYPAGGHIVFDGGKNSKFERALIPDNESPDCANVIFDAGSVETRQGYSKLNTASVGSFACDGLYTRHDSDGSETMCAFYGGHFFTVNGTSMVTVPSAQSVFTAGVRMAACEQEDYLFMGNGGQIPYKWNGAEFTRHGVYPPTTTSTVASQGTGVLTGDFTYKVTTVNSNLVESDVGPVTATFTAASATLRVSSIPTFAASYGVNARRLYRSDAGTWKRVTTISDNTTTTFDDNVTTAALGVAAPTDNGVPPKYNACIYHQNRLFVNDPANPNLVWYSELGNPYTFASTNFRNIGDSSGDIVRGFGVYDNSVVVYCDKSVWLIYMPETDDSTWLDIRVQTPFGSKSQFAPFNFNDKQMFAAMQNDKFVGFAAIKGNAGAPSATLLTTLGVGSELQSDRVEPDMFNVSESLVGQISAIVYKNKAWITVPYGSNATANNRVYHFDFSISNLSKKQEGSWVPFTGMSATQFTIWDGNLYFGSSTANGYIYQAENGLYSDDGAAIDSYYWTKEFAGQPGDEHLEKDFRYANILIDNSGSYYMNLTYRVDSDSGIGTTNQINLDPGGSQWGTMEWGENWGGGLDQDEDRVYLGTSRGQRIQFKFSNQNTVNQKFKVHWMNFAYNIKGFR